MNKPFDMPHPDLCTVMNVGSFLRRKRDETHYPSIVVVYQDGRCGRHYLDITQDKFVEEAEEVVADTSEIREFTRSLTSIDNTRVDFADVLRRSAENGVSEGASKIIRQLLEDETK